MLYQEGQGSLALTENQVIRRDSLTNQGTALTWDFDSGGGAGEEP